jgi:hypothetical protein
MDRRATSRTRTRRVCEVNNYRHSTELFDAITSNPARVRNLPPAMLTARASSILPGHDPHPPVFCAKREEIARHAGGNSRERRAVGHFDGNECRLEHRLPSPLDIVPATGHGGLLCLLRRFTFDGCST